MSDYGLSERYTIEDFVCAVLAIDNEDDAAKFYAGHVAHIQRTIDKGEWNSSSTAEEGAKSNIGWCFGEGMSDERRAMWVKVCGASHPVFGTKVPTAGEAFKMGETMGGS